MWVGSKIEGPVESICLAIEEVTRDIALQEAKNPVPAGFVLQSPQLMGGKKINFAPEDVTFYVAGKHSTPEDIVELDMDLADAIMDTATTEHGHFRIKAKAISFKGNVTTEKVLAWAERRRLKPGDVDMMFEFDAIHDMCKPLVTLFYLDRCNTKVPSIEDHGKLTQTPVTGKWEEGIYFFFVTNE